jgi:adenosylcobinamide kinase/adenosylcobinamide-phosphate guanylyltransferase
MKTLFIGGIKSGKSYAAERYVLDNYRTKPVYLTITALDEEFQREYYELSRADQFIVEEEPLFLTQYISNASRPVLVEGITVWISNMLYHSYDEKSILDEVDKILALEKDIVFVQNDITCTLVLDNENMKKMIDISGAISMKLGRGCHEVYHCVAGISNKIKG